MRTKNHVGWLLYLVAFGWISLGNLLAPLISHTDSFVFFQILKAFRHPGGHLDIAPIISSLSGIVALWTIFAHACHIKPGAVLFFRILFFFRLAAEPFAHYYEWQFLKAVQRNDPLLVVFILIIFFGIFFPSYKVHFQYAFGKTRE